MYVATPLLDAGERPEDTVSSPRLNVHSAAETATPEPLEDPDIHAAGM